MVELTAKPEDTSTPEAEELFWKRALIVASVLEEPIAAMVRGTQIAIQPSHLEQVRALHAEAEAERIHRR